MSDRLNTDGVAVLDSQALSERNELLPRVFWWVAALGGIGVLGTLVIPPIFLDATFLESVAAGVQVGLLVVALLALIFARSQVLAANEANRVARVGQMAAAEASKLASEQNERDSRAATRPYVYAEVVPGLGGSATWDLVLRNHGRTTARNLLVVTDWAKDDFAKKLSQFCSTERDLPPGASLRLFWRVEDPNGGPASGQEPVTKVDLTYEDDQGGHWRESYVADCSYGKATPAPQEGDNAGGGEDKHIRNINFALRAIAGSSQSRV